MERLTENYTREDLLRNLLLKDLKEFVKYFWNVIIVEEFVDGAVVDLLCENVMYAVRDYIEPEYKDWWISDEEYEAIEGINPIRDEKYKKRHSISIPPRHSKSAILNVFTRAWLVTHGKVRCAAISHSNSLSFKMTEDVKKILNSEKYQELFGYIEITKNMASEIETSNLGSSYAIGMANFTGYGANVIISDDIVSSHTAMIDGKILQNANNYITHTLPSRFNDRKKGIGIIIGQRLSINDPIGFILDNPTLKAQYTFTVLEAIATKDYCYKTPCKGKVLKWKQGQGLWEERFGDYSDVKNEQGYNVFECQYQQNPQASDRIVFKKEWTTITEEYTGTERYISFDFPFKNSETSDYAGISMAIMGDKLHFTSVKQIKQGYVESRDYVLRTHDAFPNAIKLIEDKASGTALVQDLEQSVPGIIPYNPGGMSKTMRAGIAATYIQRGQVTFSEKCGEEFFKQFFAFPDVENDDMVDAVVQNILFVFADKPNEVYGNVFNSNNIVEYAPTKEREFIGVYKQGLNFKIGHIGYNTKQDTFTLHKIATTTDLKAYLTDNNIKTIYECSLGLETHSMFKNTVGVIRPKGTHKEMSNLLSMGFLSNNVRIDKSCGSAISDVRSYKWRDKINETYTTDGGYVNILKTIVYAIKGKGGVFK